MCDCEVCIRHRNFEERLARVPEQDRAYFQALLEQLADVEMDREYYRAIVRNTWPGADRILARFRCAASPAAPVNASAPG